MLFRQNDLLLLETLMNGREIVWIKVLAIVDTAHVSLIVVDCHALSVLRVVQVGIEHDDRVGKDVDGILTRDLGYLVSRYP